MPIHVPPRSHPRPRHPSLFPPRFIAFTGLFLACAALQVGAAEAPNQAPGAPVPAGWRLAYEQHFDSREALGSLAMTDAGAWSFAADGNSQALELVRQSKYVPAIRSPLNIALLAEPVFGDFILEVDLIQTGKEYGHRDMCLFFGVQDPAHFYYVHLATAADDHAHNVFIVNGAPRTKLTTPLTAGVNWGLGVWHKVRLERRVAEDKTFGAGWVGLGSFDDTGKVDNIRVWAPKVPEMKAVPFFTRGGGGGK